MVNYDLVKAKKAVQLLVDSTYFTHHTRKLRSAIKRPRCLPFKDKLEPLNTLVVIGRQSEAAMENLIALAAFKREDHNDYQRKFMAVKRQRERRVIALQEKMRKTKLNVEQRRQVLTEQYEQWAREKDTFIQASYNAYTTQFGEHPGWSQKNEFIKDFWAIKDMELSMMEDQAALLESTVFAPKKRVVHNRQPPPPSVIAQKLMAIVDKKQ